jgi:hypothetical protein
MGIRKAKKDAGGDERTDALGARQIRLDIMLAQITARCAATRHQDDEDREPAFCHELPVSM